MLHSRTLRYLEAVARAGSIRKAATRLNVSATAVNRQILLLEETLGTPVFQRLPRGLRLTATGEILVEHARRTLQDYRLAAARIEALKGLRGGEVTIATQNGLIGGIVPRAVATFRAGNPHIRVNGKVLVTRDIVRALVEGEADLALAYNLPRDARLVTAHSFAAELGAVVAPGHPLAARPRLRLTDCAAYPLIVADPSLALHQIVLDAFLRANLPVEPPLQSNSIEFMIALALAGEGVAFLSRFDIAESESAGALVFRPTGNRDLATNTLHIVHRAKGVMDGAALLFMETLTGVLQGVGSA